MHRSTHFFCVRLVSSTCALSLTLAMPALGHAAAYNVIDLGTLGGTASGGGAINNSGLVTGGANIATPNDPHAFLYDGTMHDLGTLSGTFLVSGGNAINASGQIAGTSGVLGRAFLYDGTLHDLGTLGGNVPINSQGLGINAAGHVVGISTVSNTNSFTHAFLYDTSMHDLNTLGGNNSGATAINDAGLVTGYSDTAGNACERPMR